MKQIIALFSLLVSMILVAAWATNPASVNKFLPKTLQIEPPVKTSALPTPATNVEKIVRIADVEISAEIARTPAERAKGLSDRQTLAQDHGMLFVFERENVRPSFWMKDTNFPLDLIWINDGKIAQITPNVQPVPSGTPDNKIPLYLPHDAIDYVLEVPAGTVEENKIKVGDSASFPPLAQ